MNNAVARFETENLLVSTILAGDSHLYETGIWSPHYSDRVIIVETYKTYSAAVKGHESWVRVLNVPYEDLPDVIKIAHSTFMSLLAGDESYEKKPIAN